MIIKQMLVVGLTTVGGGNGYSDELPFQLGISVVTIVVLFAKAEALAWSLELFEFSNQLSIAKSDIMLVKNN